MEKIVQSARDLLAEKMGIQDAAREVFRSTLLDPTAFRDALMKAAASAPSEPKVPLWQLPLFFHEGAHPAPFGRHFGDSLDNLHAPGNYREEDGSRPMRDRFWSLLAANGVTATFVGHSHHTAQTWAADPAARDSAVYEFESGGVANTTASSRAR